MQFVVCSIMQAHECAEPTIGPIMTSGPTKEKLYFLLALEVREAHLEGGDGAGGRGRQLAQLVQQVTDVLVVEHMLGDFQLRRRRVCVQIGHERLENPKGGGGELPRLKLGPVADTIRGTPMELEARSQGGHPRQGGHLRQGAKEAIRSKEARKPSEADP